MMKEAKFNSLNLCSNLIEKRTQKPGVGIGGSA